jgi:hypothetical protein
MKQTTFASTVFELVTKRTRKREFLDEVNLVMPWTELTRLDPALCASKQYGPSTFSHCHNALHPFHAAVVWPV